MFVGCQQWPTDFSGCAPAAAAVQAVDAPAAGAPAPAPAAAPANSYSAGGYFLYQVPGEARYWAHCESDGTSGTAAVGRYTDPTSGEVWCEWGPHCWWEAPAGDAGPASQ